jgi:hypothetical protein
MPAPIALFVYSRPNHTRHVLDSLRRNTLSGQSDLIIFSDAARKPEHEASVNSVRAMIQKVDGFKSVRVVQRDRNLGLAASIEDGVRQICDDYGKVIVVEDDLIVSPYFLAFLNASLDRYEGEASVMQVSAYMFPGSYDAECDALFLPLISCWGWATWKRAWEQYDPKASGFSRLKEDSVLREKFDLGGAYEYFKMLEQQVRGEINSWGIKWLLSVFLHQGVVLYPKHTLVSNTGVDGSGTHGAGVAALQVADISADRRYGNPRLPEHVAVNPNALEKVRRNLRALRPGIVRRVVQRLVG